jgi:integrase
VHHPALPFAEVGNFMATLRQQDGVAAACLEFAILTCARRDEAREMPWSEFKEAERMWVVPAERMKMRKEHRVPLSDAALAILEKMKAIRVGDFVFPGRDFNRPISPGTLFTVLRGLGRKDITTHGFRSSFADWAKEITSHGYEVRERALAHTKEEAYARSDLFDKRRQLMADWAGYCGRLPDERGTVVAFGR